MSIIICSSSSSTNVFVSFVVMVVGAKLHLGGIHAFQWQVPKVCKNVDAVLNPNHALQSLVILVIMSALTFCVTQLNVRILSHTHCV